MLNVSGKQSPSSPKPLAWTLPAGSPHVVLRGDWSPMGERRELVPLEEFTGMLAAPEQAPWGLPDAKAAASGSWVFYARRLRQATEAWADVLVHAESDPVGALQGRVLDLSGRLAAAPGPGDDGQRTLDFALRLVSDLRIPVRQLHDCLQLVRQTLHEHDEVRKWLHHADSSLSRTRGVVHDAHELLLTISGRKQAMLERYSLGLLVGAAARMHQPAADAEGHVLAVEADCDTSVLVDFAAFTMVLDNLVNNAIRHTPGGTTVLVQAAQDASGAGCLRVSDNGNRLKDTHLAQLFEPFYRADRNSDGTGLGLALVLELCRMMNASIFMQRNDSGGLTVEVRLQRTTEQH